MHIGNSSTLNGDAEGGGGVAMFAASSLGDGGESVKNT